MQLTLDIKKDTKRVLAVGAVSLALITGITFPASAKDGDSDDLSDPQKIEKVSSGDTTGSGEVTALWWRWWR